VNSDQSAEVIRKRMAELRSELTSDVRDVKRSAREMTNPLYYVRRFPWATAAAAAVIGYLLVPKKKQVIKPDPEMLAELIRKHQINFDTTKAPSDSQGMLKSLAVMGLTWALRTGLTYAGEQLAAAATRKSEHQAERESDDETPPAAPSPVEEPLNTKR
jgi:hypothetical protein